MQRTLDDLLAVCGPDRPLAVCRELTKLHEEVWRTTTGEAAERARGSNRGASTCWCWGRSRRRLAKKAVTKAAALLAYQAKGPAAAPEGQVPWAGGPLLRDYADLLRQRRPPHRPRLHHGDRRRPGPVAPAARRRRVLPHRHRRARAEGAAGGRSQRAHARRSRPTVQRPFPGGVGAARHLLRRLHPHHRAAPPPGRTGLDAGRLRQRLDQHWAPTRGCTASPARPTTPRPTWSTACARSTTGPSSC